MWYRHVAVFHISVLKRFLAFICRTPTMLIEWPQWGAAVILNSLRWRHNGRVGVWNHQPHDCLLKVVLKKTSKLRVTGLCVGNSPATGEFPAQMASNAENFSIWWRHYVILFKLISMWYWTGIAIIIDHTDGLMQGCSISSALAMDILQSCTNPSISRIDLLRISRDIAPM